MDPTELEVSMPPTSKSLWRWPSLLVGVSCLVGVGLVWGFRSRNPVVLGAVRRFNRSVLNPAITRFSGRKGFYAATIHHVGRRSGIPYATPVIAEPVEGGFLVPLPYGTEVDWLRNVLASGRAILDADGRTVIAEHPAVTSFEEAADRFPRTMARSLRLVGTRDVLHLTATGLATPATA
jgi:deazaflavin-dependent oxidoreductase (nitroreductase family)